jgi:hypothetical protein
MDGAELLRSRKIMPRDAIYSLYHISPPFVNIVCKLCGEKPWVTVEVDDDDDDDG